jgi:hypothetical protein
VRLEWLWTLFVAFGLGHSLYHLWKTAWERGTADDELLVDFVGKQNPWSMKLLGAKLLIVAVVYLPLQLKIGRGLDAWLLSLSMLFNAISLLVDVPPTVGIHKSGLFLENAWLKWDTVRRYRWTNPGTLEINPGFFSFSYRKLDIPDEFVPDVRAMLDSQCPGCEMQAP